MTHAEYCRNKTARYNARTTFFPDGYVLTQINGEDLTDAELEAKYPVNGRLTDYRAKRRAKGENPNGRLVK